MSEALPLHVRRVLAVPLDIAAQIFIFWIAISGLPATESLSPVLVLASPLLYSVSAIVAGASPAQILLGLRVITTESPQRRLLLRGSRALILKSPYLVLVIGVQFSQGLGSEIALTHAFVLPLVILGFFVVAAIQIQSEDVAFYDLWLSTEVVSRRDIAQTKRGFAVITGSADRAG